MCTTLENMSINFRPPPINPELYHQHTIQIDNPQQRVRNNTAYVPDFEAVYGSRLPQGLASFGPFQIPEPVSHTIVVANGHGGARVVPLGSRGWAEYRPNGDEREEPIRHHTHAPPAPPLGIWWDGYRPSDQMPR